MSAPSNETRYELPEIISFKTSDKVVEKRESFSLFWDVKNAENIEIFKNDVLFLKRDAEETSVVIHETYDGKDKEVKYTLIAINDIGQTHSLPLTVKVVDFKSRHLPSPEIVYFETSLSLVQNKEPFTLSWEVENASHVDLYRNGLIFKKYSGGKASAVLHESYDGKDKDVVYTLLASTNKEKVESSPLTISVKEKLPLVGQNRDVDAEERTEPDELIKEENNDIPPEPNSDSSSSRSDTQADKNTLKARNQVSYEDEETPLVQDRYQHSKQRNLRNIRLALWGISLVAAAILFGVFYYFQSKPRILDFDPKSNKEDHSIVIVGKNFPTDSNQFQIFFNRVRGSVQYSSREIIRVVIPVLKEQPNTDSSNIEAEIVMVYKGDTLRASKKLTVIPNVVAKKSESVVNTVAEDVPIIDSPVVEKIKKNSKLSDKPKDLVVEKVPAKVDSQLTEKKEEPKKRVDVDILKSVTVSASEGSKKFLGGIKGLKVTVVNNSAYDLDLVNVTVTYLKSNEREVKKEQMVFANVKAHLSMTLDGPKTNRGSKATATIASVNSKQLDADMRR